MKYIRLLLAFGLAVGSYMSASAQSSGIADPGRVPYYDAFNGKTVSVLVATMGLDLSQAWVSTLQRDLEPLGVNIKVRDYSWKPEVGAQAMNSMIGEKPDVIVVHNVDVTSMSRMIKAAEKANIPVVQLNTKATYTSTAYVGVDWTEIGEKAASTLVDTCMKPDAPSKKVAIMQGAVTDPASTYQLRGIMNIMEQHPEIEIVSNQAAEWDSSKAHAIMSTVLKQHPDLCGATGFWDGMDVGMGQAVLDAQLDHEVVVVSSGGGATSACDNLNNGVFTNYVTFDAPLQGHDLSQAVGVVLQQKLEPSSAPFYMYSKLKVLDHSTVTSDSCWDLKDYKPKR